jgi:hypothetical protein
VAREGWSLSSGPRLRPDGLREGELPDWAETVSAPRALARITRPVGTRPTSAIERELALGKTFGYSAVAAPTAKFGEEDRPATLSG